MKRNIYGALEALAIAGLVGLYLVGSRSALGDDGGSGAAPNWSGNFSDNELARMYPHSNLGATAKMPPVILEGLVQRVDTQNDTVTLSSGKELKLSSETQVMRNGSAVSLSSVQEGDEVRAACEPGSQTDVEQLTITAVPGPSRE